MENNPYGMLALWNQGGWVIRFVAIVLFGMSIVSWTIIVVRAWKACKLSGLSKRVRLFWLAPSFRGGTQDTGNATGGQSVSRVGYRRHGCGDAIHGWSGKTAGTDGNG